jgi:DNA ligase 1
MHHRKLYHLDSLGNVRVWWMEQDGHAFRTYSGIDGGKIVVSDWKYADVKNFGKSNETTPEAQATFEIESLYTKKLDRKYSENKNTAARSNYLQPMLAATFDPKKTKRKRYAHQPKLDGIRALIDDEGGNSRSGKPFFTVQHIVDEVADICDLNNITLDGELYNHEYKDQFEDLTSLIVQKKVENLTADHLELIRSKVHLYVYDVIVHDDLTMPFHKRNAIVEKLFAENTFVNLKLVPTDYEDISKVDPELLHTKWLEEGYEGIMFRDPDAKYEFKRAKTLYKHKTFIDDEFEVIDIVEGVGNWAECAKSIVLKMPNGTECSSGIKGTQEFLRKVLINKADYIGGDATVKFQGFTAAGKLRFPVVKKLWGSKRDV